MNKNFKKTLSVILAVLMAASCFSVVSFATTTYAGHEEHHIIPNDAKAPSGCTDGKTESVYCVDCSKWLVESTVDPAPHNPGDWEISETVTDCTLGYTVQKKCKDCQVIVAVDQIKEHDFQTTKIDQPYCDVEGTIYKKCTVCPKEVTQTAETKLHSWGTDTEKGWVTQIMGNCTLDGVETRACENCLREEERAIPATGHKYQIVDSGKIPTCTEDGSTARRGCLNCGDVIPGDTLNKKGHTDADGDSYCDVCETYFTAEAPDGCSCPCHSKSGILKVLYEIVIFILSLFKVGANCACGAVHYTVD